MASSSSSRLDFVLQNLIAKFALQFPVLAPNKVSVSPSKKIMVCYHRPRNNFGQLWMSGFSNQTIISKLWTIKRVYSGWVQKKTIFISTHNNYLRCPSILHTKAQL
jgi:hypothetical protein